MTEDARRHGHGLALFVSQRRRDRFAAALAKGGPARAKELARLHDRPGLDPRWIVDAPKPTTASGRESDLLATLAKLAPGVTRAHIVSGDADLDGTTQDLATALRAVPWTDDGSLISLISLIPGRVAVYTGELADDVLILHRDPHS